MENGEQSGKYVMTEAHKQAIAEGRRRAYRRKGKWSLEARQRLRERLARKREATLIMENGGALTIMQRLDLVDAQVKKIREQLGALKAL
jgi:hypothetical protein